MFGQWRSHLQVSANVIQVVLLLVLFLLAVVFFSGCWRVDQYIREGRYSEAVEQAKEDARLYPNDYVHWYWLGVAYARRGDFDEAIRALKRCLELTPQSVSQSYRASIYNEIGVSYLGKGLLALAVASLQRATELDPASTVYKENLKKVLDRQLTIAMAQQRDLERIEVAKQSAIQMRIDQGKAAEDNGQLRKALDIYQSALGEVKPYGNQDKLVRERIIGLVRRLDPRPTISEEARRHVVYGLTAMKEVKTPADYENAIKEFHKASQLAPWWGDAYLDLALAQENRGNYGDAAQSLSLFLLASPNDPEAEKAKTKMYELDYKAKAGKK